MPPRRSTRPARHKMAAHGNASMAAAVIEGIRQSRRDPTEDQGKTEKRCRNLAQPIPPTAEYHFVLRRLLFFSHASTLRCQRDDSGNPLVEASFYGRTRCEESWAILTAQSALLSVCLGFCAPRPPQSQRFGPVTVIPGDVALRISSAQGIRGKLFEIEWVLIPQMPCQPPQVK